MLGRKNGNSGMSDAVYDFPTTEPGELLGKAGKLTRSTGDKSTYHTSNHPFDSLSGNAALLKGKAPDRKIYPKTEPSRT